jgi:hypothetical protein
MEHEIISLEEVEEPTELATEETALEADVVDEVGEAVGLTYQADESLRIGEKETERDHHRWELDPASADDYAERMHRHTDGPAGEVLHMTHRGHLPHRSEP